VEHLNLTNQIQELALSPDGKKLAFIVHGEVFAASSKDGGDAARVTTTSGAESQVAWAPDGRRLVYVSDRSGVNQIYLYDFRAAAETQLTRGALHDGLPAFSPDGKSLAFERGQRELRVIDVESGQEHVAAKGYLSDRLASGRPVAWSPDGRWIAYVGLGSKGFTNVFVAASVAPASVPASVASASVPARPAESGRQVSFLANAFAGSVSWSPDGTFLLFNTSQRTEAGQLARVDLTLRVPKFREDQFRDLFQDETPRPAVPATPAAPKPATPDPAAPEPVKAGAPAADKSAPDTTGVTSWLNIQASAPSSRATLYQSPAPLRPTAVS